MRSSIYMDIYTRTRTRQSPSLASISNHYPNLQPRRISIEIDPVLTMSSTRNPNIGTKVSNPGCAFSLPDTHLVLTRSQVDASSSDPVKQENSGVVAPDSLAAESMNDGGAFAQNTAVRTDDFPLTSGGASIPESYGGEAPSYVASTRDKGGPHGRGIREVDSMNGRRHLDGQREAMRAEPGSEYDPSRLAEREFEKQQNVAGRDAGPRQDELDGGTVYDTLKSDVPL